MQKVMNQKVDHLSSAKDKNLLILRTWCHSTSHREPGNHGVGASDSKDRICVTVFLRCQSSLSKHV